MSEDRNRLAENDDGEQADDDVEAHRLAKDPTTDDSDDGDDVEAHRLAYAKDCGFEGARAPQRGALSFSSLAPAAEEVDEAAQERVRGFRASRPRADRAPAARSATSEACAIPGQSGPGLSRGHEQRQCDRRLGGEQAEQLHLPEREAGLRGPIEHLEHAEHALLVEERDGHDALRARSRSAPRCRGRSAGRPARPRARAASASEATQPAIPVDDGKRWPTRNCSCSLATAAKTSSSASSSSRKIDEPCAPKIARATSTIDRRSRVKSSSEAITPAATAA